jgi:hypothetical protein
MYFPKSQITTNLSTNGKEFQVVGTDEYYIGSYFKTSDGRFYTGKTPQDGNNKLLEKTLLMTQLPDSLSNNLIQITLQIVYLHHI